MSYVSDSVPQAHGHIPKEDPKSEEQPRAWTRLLLCYHGVWRALGGWVEEEQALEVDDTVPDGMVDPSPVGSQLDAVWYVVTFDIYCLPLVVRHIDDDH